MTWKPKRITSRREHAVALKYIDAHWEESTDKAFLTILCIEEYEKREWPIGALNPIAAIRYRMEEGRHTQADLARLLGSRSHASEVLAGKRPLSIAMMRRLHKEWGIPAESLLAEP